MSLIRIACRRCAHGGSSSARIAIATGPGFSMTPARGLSGDSDEGNRGGAGRPRGPTSERGQESHGAMKKFFQEQSNAPSTGSGATAWGDIIGTVKASSDQANSLVGRDFNKEQARGPGRSFNSRVGGAKKRKGVAPAAGAGGGGGTIYEGDKGMANVFGRKADGYDEEGEDDGADGVPPEVENYLYDSPFFEDKVAKGLEMDYGDMDPIEKFFADAFMESFRHKNHEVSVVIDKEGTNRIRLPTPRPTRELVASLYPNITSVSKETDQDAYQLGEEAWMALSKNIYYSDAEKRYMANKIARDAKSIYDGAVELEKTGEVDEYRLWSPDFRKGFDGLTLEQRRELFGDDDFFDEVSEIAEMEAHLDGTDLTDYDVEAVVDEDQLFE